MLNLQGGKNYGENQGFGSLRLKRTFFRITFGLDLFRNETLNG